MKIERGQVAVVTGAASGIGLALAEAFASRGVRVVLADVRLEPLTTAAAKVETGGAEVLAVETDVRDAASVDALAARTLDHFGRVDVICNNAGVVGSFAPMWEQDVGTWRWILDVTLMGVVHGVRSFVPHLVAQGTGHVLNTASVGGLMPLPMLSPYNAAKHAVVGLSETLHAELRQSAPGVGVTVLCPGRVDTPLGETSAQNRPPGVPSPSMAPEADPQRPAFARAADTLASPSDIAEGALAAIERDRLHVVVPAEAAAPARRRVDALLADL